MNSGTKVALTALLAVAVLVGAGSVLSSCGSGYADAPQFSGVTLDGSIVALDQYRGKPLLLAYMTSG
jgi:hypothetical protein